jgi:hypothetical protein
LKHSERIDIWNNQSTFLNKIITYRHMPGGAVDAPRHARFYRFREDYNV